AVLDLRVDRRGQQDRERLLEMHVHLWLDLHGSRIDVAGGEKREEEIARRSHTVGRSEEWLRACLGRLGSVRRRAAAQDHRQSSGSRGPPRAAESEEVDSLVAELHSPAISSPLLLLPGSIVMVESTQPAS